MAQDVKDYGRLMDNDRKASQCTLYQVVPRDLELPQDNGIIEVMLLATIPLLSNNGKGVCYLILYHTP